MTCDDPAKKPKKEQCNRKTNLLVYEQPAGTKVERSGQAECRTTTLRPPICAPKAKQIRVCTGAEMKRMCPPKVCVCPQPKRSAKGLTGLLMLGLKSAIAAAAVYVSYDMGIWGSTQDTQNLYQFICGAKSRPSTEKAFKWEPPSCDAERDLFTLPRHDPYGHCKEPPVDLQSTYSKFQSCWNKAVWTICSGIANFPGNLTGKGDKSETFKAAQEEEKEECVPYSQLDEEEMERVRVQNKYK